jgi:hypothetical protein
VILLGWETSGAAAARFFSLNCQSSLTLQGLAKLIEVVFAPGRCVVQPPRWPDGLLLVEEPDGRTLPEAALAAPQLAEEPDGQTLPEAALVAPQPAEELDARRPPVAAPAAELPVSQRPEVG